MFYSSIPENKRKAVIEKCYWPIFELAEKVNVPIGIEISGVSLEVINKLDKKWVNKFKKLLAAGKCELIGSGYMQIIGPLVPAEVNEKNQRFGMEIYQKMLGVKPKIALVNEQAYSSGMITHYLKAGYKAIIMEWNNPYKFHPEWKREWQFYPQYAVDKYGNKISVIWNNAIAFQKFQRYVHRETDLDTYFKYLHSEISVKKRILALYGNDAEIFDYRPGRFFTEAKLGRGGEWARIAKLFDRLKEDKRFNLICPSEARSFSAKSLSGHKLKLESAECPIPVKKQGKYNITRWAVTGREDTNINTKCWQIYEALKNVKKRTEKTDFLWKKLCYLWGSDFRTHIDEKRFQKYRKELDTALKESGVGYKKGILKEKKRVYKKKSNKVTERNNLMDIDTPQVKITLNRDRGLAIHKLFFKKVSSEPLIGTLYHGYYDDISYAADFYTGHTIIEFQGKPKITDLVPVKPVCNEMGEYLSVKAGIKTSAGNVAKEIKIYKKLSRVDINYKFKLVIKTPASLKMGIVTFLPYAFDEKSLYYKTVNGGFDPESFNLEENVDHTEEVNSLISSSHCLGSTEGWTELGDKQKSIRISSDKKEMYCVPMVKFQKVDDTYFLRIYHSLAETDETAKFPLKLSGLLSFSLSERSIYR